MIVEADVICEFCGSDDIYFADYGVAVCHACFDDNCEGVRNYLSHMVKNDLKDF
jgi:hypothetical protein